MSEKTVAMIPVKSIRENPVALRTVNKKSEEYIGLVDSIRRDGVLNSILVREIPSDNGEKLYGLIDGLHRYNASCDAGLELIPAQITDMDEAEILEAQILANVHKIETKPVEYTKQLQRIMSQNPTLTMSEMASRLSKSPAWLNDRFGLIKLTEEIGKLVDENKITLSNAYALAKLPVEAQADYLDRAITQPPSEFVPTIQKVVKELRDAKRQGRDPNAKVEAPFHLQKISELKAELENPRIIPALLAKHNVTSPVEAALLALKWCGHQDPESVAEFYRKDEARKAQKKAEAEKRKEERDAQKLAEAKASVGV